MDYVNIHAVESETGSFTVLSDGLLEQTTPMLLQRVLELLSAEGSIVLLVGESGTGKSRLAQDAVQALEQRLGAPLETITLVAPSNPLSAVAARFGVGPTVGAGRAGTFTVHTDGAMADGVMSDAVVRDAVVSDAEPGDPEPGEPGLQGGAASDLAAKRLLDSVVAIAHDAQRGDVVVLVQGVDQYSARLTYLIDSIVRVPGVRVIATARGLSGAAAHLAGNTRASAVPVPPLTIDESHRYLRELLGVESIEAYSLRKWYRLTEGNALSLMLLALALDSEGRMGRSRGVAFEVPGPTLVPSEFWDQLRESCSGVELRTLETIALTEPLGESVLIRELDPQALSKLRARGMLKAHRDGGRGAHLSLSLSHKLLAAAVREQIPEEQVREITGKLLDALTAVTADAPTRGNPVLLVRLVSLGLDAHRTLPCDWIFEALCAPPELKTPELQMRMAQAILRHPDASTTQYATAVLHEVKIARELGEYSVLEQPWTELHTALKRLRPTVAATSMLRIKLELELVRRHGFQLGDTKTAHALLDGLERELGDTMSPARAAILGERAMLLGATGELKAAARYLPNPETVGSMPIEWERTTSRVVSSLHLGQQGRFADALRVADQSAAYALMGEKPQTELARMLQFCGFVNFWRCGATEAARYELATMIRAAHHGTGYSGYAEVASAMMSLADGKWRLTVQRAERLVERLSGFDAYGLAPLAHAVLALGLAALGEKGASRRAIRAAEARGVGISQALVGYVRVLTLRARLWNHDTGIPTIGLKLAAWARTEELATVELLALHIVAIEERGEARGYIGRIRLLASEIEPPFSSAVLAHCEDLVTGAAAWEGPSARALTELGIWMPLPATDALSAREREIALYASQGYSSRWIAEQFHLSVRTVDTHLRHVFTKLRVAGRDELRHWFRRDHQTW